VSWLLLLPLPPADPPTHGTPGRKKILTGRECVRAVYANTKPHFLTTCSSGPGSCACPTHCTHLTHLTHGALAIFYLHFSLVVCLGTSCCCFHFWCRALKKSLKHHTLNNTSSFESRIWRRLIFKKRYL